MDPWVRLFMWVTKVSRPRANQMAHDLDFDSGGGRTFGTLLSASGEEPATHFGASTLVRESTVPIIIDQLLPQLPGAKLYRETDRWTWRTALRDAGLRKITNEE